MNLLITLSAAGILAMLGSVLKSRSWVLPLTVSALLVAVWLAVAGWNQNIVSFGAMRMDNFAIAFSVVCIMAAMVVLVFEHQLNYAKNEHHAEVHAIVLFSLIGAVVMVSFTSLLMLFLGVEILSLSLYVLAGLHKRDLLSNEAALKYFLMGSFSTGFLLFGMAMLYGATGSFMISDIAYYLGFHQAAPEPFVVAGIILLMIGLLFKVAVAPFHFWTPDVYQGAPTMVTGYMATVGKVAAFAALLRLFQFGLSPAAQSYLSIIAAVAVLTMFIGNITALYQKSIKRMLAYSSIAHAGYLLLALLTSHEMTNGAVLFYVIAYSLASLTAFTVVAILQEHRAPDDLSAFNGLLRKNPLLAISFATAVFSLAGIPPTAGFFAKFYIFSAVVHDGWIWVVAVAVINSFISVYYYFRPMLSAFVKKGGDEPFIISAVTKFLLILLTVLTIATGILPGMLAALL